MTHTYIPQGHELITFNVLLGPVPGFVKAATSTV